MSSKTYSLNETEKNLLMELQYNFPLTPTPILDVAENLGISVEEAISLLRGLVKNGVLKRIGFYYNYRSQGHVATLAAFATGGRYEVIAEKLRRDPLVTHNFLRDHPDYDVWAVVKRKTREELVSYIERVAKEGGASKWILLWSKKTFKLSVKFDLNVGISRSGRYARVVEDPPRPEDLGIDPRIPRMARTLRIEERPYKHIGNTVGMKEEEVVSLVKEMLDKGILADPGAALEGKVIGFKENAMVVMEPQGDGYSLCECASRLPYSTHVVLRDPYPPGAWRHICYFMVHATSRSRIEEAVGRAREECRPRDLMAIYSIMDLKPQVVR